MKKSKNSRRNYQNNFFFEYKIYLENTLLLSKNTIKSYIFDLTLFLKYLQKRRVDYTKIDKNIILNYFSYLQESNSKEDKPVSKATINRKICSLRTFYNYLLSKKITDKNPFNKVHQMKSKRKIPKVLFEQDIRSLLNYFKSGDSPIQYRNYLIFYTLFSTGIRVSELVNITFNDINLDSRTLKVCGKGNKERIVSLSKKEVKAIRYYFDHIRKYFEADDNEYLFINYKGGKMSVRSIQKILHNIGLRCGVDIGCNLHPHILRHTFATILFENGFNIREIQELLGHDSINTTMIYTHSLSENDERKYKTSFTLDGKK